MCLNPSALFVNSIKHPALQTISSASFRNERDITCQELEDEYRNAKPLTAVYEDAQGRIIQLWKTHAYGLVGSVVDSEGTLQ